MFVYLVVVETEAGSRCIMAQRKKYPQGPVLLPPAMSHEQGCTSVCAYVAGKDMLKCAHVFVCVCMPVCAHVHAWACMHLHSHMVRGKHMYLSCASVFSLPGIC